MTGGAGAAGEGEAFGYLSGLQIAGVTVDVTDL